MELLNPSWCSKTPQHHLHRREGANTIYDRLQRLLQLAERILKLLRLVCTPQRARVHELQGDLHGHAVGIEHEGPVSLDGAEDALQDLIHQRYISSYLRIKNWWAIEQSSGD